MRSREAYRYSVIVVAALVLVPSTSNALDPISIDFDQDPSGNQIPAEWTIATTYNSEGVTFRRAALSIDAYNYECSGVLARLEDPDGLMSSNKVVSLCDDSDDVFINENSHGFVQVANKQDLSEVCVDAVPLGNSSAVLRAYDYDWNVVSEQISAPGRSETMCVTGVRMRQILFSGHGDGHARFDNLEITPAASTTRREYFAPAVANLTGVGGAQWQTDLEVYYPPQWPYDYDIATERDLVITLYPRGPENQTPVVKSFTMYMAQHFQFENVLETVFDYEGAATLSVRSTDKLPLIVSARSYNAANAGTYGMGFQALTLDDAIGPGRRGVLLQLQQSIADDVGFRSNVGFFNPNAFPIEIELRLYVVYGDGEWDANLYPKIVNVPLKPFESLQYTRVFRQITDGEVASGYAIVSSDTPEAAFFAYATPIDNRTGDGFFVWPKVQDSFFVAHGHNILWGPWWHPWEDGEPAS